MSVKNQYARNYCRIAPMPKTAAEIQEARDAVKRRTTYRNSVDYETDPYRKDYRANVTDTRRHSDHLTGTGYSNQHQAVGPRMLNSTGSTYTKYNHTATNVEKQLSNNQSNVDRGVIRGVRSDSDIRTNSGSSKTSTVPPDEQEPYEMNTFRPKSARPESRWQRRTGDEDGEEPLPVFSDTDSDSDPGVSTNGLERPLTARPDSRAMRMTESKNNQNTVNQMQQSTKSNVKAPVRPTTSRGRKTSDSGSSVESQPQYNESRAPVERPYQLKIETKVKRTPSDTIQKYAFKKFDPQHNSKIPVPRKYKKSYNENALSPSKDFGPSPGAVTPRDIFFGIEEIDLDVDPVEYFNSPLDDTKFVKAYKNKTPLSKSTINIISDEKSATTQKPVSTTGFYGDTQNKSNNHSELSDCNHGNRPFVLKNVMTKPAVITGVSPGQTRRTSYSINGKATNYARDRVTEPSKAGSKGNIRAKNQENRVVSLATGEKVHMQFPFGPNNKKAGGTKYKPVIHNRQPRKLCPIDSEQRIE